MNTFTKNLKYGILLNANNINLVLDTVKIEIKTKFFHHFFTRGVRKVKCHFLLDVKGLFISLSNKELEIYYKRSLKKLSLLAILLFFWK
jgi:hypothetical protein